MKVMKVMKDKLSYDLIAELNGIDPNAREAAKKAQKTAEQKGEVIWQKRKKPRQRKKKIVNVGQFHILTS